jgi:copper chaperone
MNKYEFQVTGMSCGHCVAKVESALKPLAKKVKVNLGKGVASVQTDRPAQELLAALDEAGYPGTLK